MKLKILFSFLALLLVSRMNAAPVTQQKAQTVALNFYLQSINTAITASYNAVLGYTKMEADNSVDFYVFDITPGNSYVIVSGDDRANPVIGYSPQSYFNSNFYGSPFETWVNHTAAKVHSIVLNNLAASSDITKKWNAYSSGTKVSPAIRGAVAPLLVTTWDQAPYYNANCPKISSNDPTVTGCVATTMAQIMKYWNYPAQGTGTYSYTDGGTGYKNDFGTLSANFGTTNYNWGVMPVSLSGPNAQVAQLMYQCGISVAMDYGDENQGGSGSYVLKSEAPKNRPSAQSSFATNFSYNPNTLKGVFQSRYSESGWISVIEQEINSGRPVEYEGVDSSYGGHTWVCDGYDNNNLLHMNWGWGGQYNGYYDVTYLNPKGSQYLFVIEDAALIGIEPLATVKITAQAASSLICSGSSTQLSSTGPVNAKYTWLPTEGLSCATCASPVANPSVSTTYVVVADSNGIKGSYAVAVEVATGITASFTPSATAGCSAPSSITFNNLSSSALTYVWDFGDGNTSTETSPTHSYASYGTYTVKLVSTGPCGVSTSNGQSIQLVDYSPSIISNDTQSICSGTAATFMASGSGGVISWYDAVTGGNMVGYGDTLNTPVLNASKTFYVQEALAAPGSNCGPVTSGIGSGGFFTGSVQHGIVFNSLAPNTTLKSVDVSANATGQMTVVLLNNVGNTIQSKIVNVVAGLNTVELDFALPYTNNLRLECSGASLYYNNTGVSYPYASSDSSVVLTGSDAGNPAYYYYFYNWKLFGDACISNRLPVHASILNSIVNFASSIGTDGVTVKFYISDGSATSAHWDFGDGTTSDVKSPSHTFPERKSYVVKLTQTNGTCVASTTQTVALKSITGVADLTSANLSLSIMPNPVRDNMQVLITLPEASGNYSLSVKNILGQNMFTNNLHLDKGDNKTTLSVSNIPAGIYFLQLAGANGFSEIRKFVKD